MSLRPTEHDPGAKSWHVVTFAPRQLRSRSRGLDRGQHRAVVGIARVGKNPQSGARRRGPFALHVTQPSGGQLEVCDITLRPIPPPPAGDN